MGPDARRGRGPPEKADGGNTTGGARSLAGHPSSVSVLRTLRPVAAVLLAVALATGPVSAACLHGAGHEMPTETTGHEMPIGEHAPAETPPCHDAPEAPPHDVPPHETPAPPADDCASACCAAQAVADAPAPLPAADAVALLAIVATDVLVAPLAEPVPTPEGPPLRPRTRLHVELERFLI